jgi:hypothetical protein
MNDTDNKLVVILLCVFITIFGIGATVVSFAPDSTAERIAACMTQPNMEYRIVVGCVAIDRN